MNNFFSNNNSTYAKPNFCISCKFEFDCVYCGKEFGDDVIKLAKHIGKEHDAVRSKN